MQTQDLSCCFVTTETASCKQFYMDYFAARASFDCGWYITLQINGDGPQISFIQPQEGMQAFTGAGVMLNFQVADVDAEHQRLCAAGLEPVMPLEDHPWGDRGFAVTDPLGNTVYIYSARQPSEEFATFFNTDRRPT